MSRGFNEEKEKESCGKCKYHWKSRETDGWYCANSQSDFFSMDTWYEDWCDEYEERD